MNDVTPIMMSSFLTHSTILAVVGGLWSLSMWMVSSMRTGDPGNKDRSSEGGSVTIATASDAIAAGTEDPLVQGWTLRWLNSVSDGKVNLPISLVVTVVTTILVACHQKRWW
jgi:uncharacterized membrane protein